MLTGKGVHALQEAGVLTISMLPINLRVSFLGIYPSWETLLGQLITLGLVVVLWRAGNRVIKKPICETHKENQTDQAQTNRLAENKPQPSTS